MASLTAWFLWAERLSMTRMASGFWSRRTGSRSVLRKSRKTGIVVPVGTVFTLKHPLISRDSKGLGERPRLLQQLCKAVDEGPEPVLGHVGYQVVERGALAEQGMGAGLDVVGLEVAVHAEALASGTE